MERDLKTSNEASGTLPMTIQQSADDTPFFITDVWQLCDRVLQRWMPHLAFDEPTPEKKNLIQ